MVTVVAMDSISMEALKMDNISVVFKKFFKEEDGVTAIEYGLIAALIAVVIIAAVRTVGTNLVTVFNQIASALASA
ncbi:Flp family type IVb pilin [Vogesella sp. LYT5W]|uniref:Flp family type IVb pilin n=1 Tax=Vogesella margarita TaxID=2984199 RepID=A0ABT5IRF2_9NEIS|nr:Flp family type IVb pilin [Vogesella margarita]MDC7715132.1 Flp family type IVb pilin [Vogesella margarita]